MLFFAGREFVHALPAAEHANAPPVHYRGRRALGLTRELRDAYAGRPNSRELALSQGVAFWSCVDY